MSWFYLALLAPLLYAIVNLLDDNLLSFVYKSPYLSTSIAGISGTLPILTLLFLNGHALPIRLAFIAIVAGFLTVCYFYFYFKGLSLENPSVVVAMFSLVPATLPFLAHFVVHERLTAGEEIGFVIILLSTLALAITDIRKLKFSKALIPILIGVIFMDAVSLMTKYDFQRASFYSVYIYFSAGMGIGGIFFFIMKYKDNKKTIIEIRKRIKKLLPIFIFAELTGIAAEITLNLAISKGPVSLVKVIESIQPMIVLIIAVIFYPVRPNYFREAKEGNLQRKLYLMAFTVMGLIIISVSNR